MPMKIIVEDERRRCLQEINDVSNVIVHLIQRISDAGKTLRVLGYVDAFGDTTLNELQQRAAVQDIPELEKVVVSPEERGILVQLREILQTSLAAPHRYTKFIGD